MERHERGSCGMWIRGCTRIASGSNTGKSEFRTESGSSCATRISFVEMQDRNDPRLTVMCVNQQTNLLIYRASAHWIAFAADFFSDFVSNSCWLVFPYFISTSSDVLRIRWAETV